MSRWHPRGARTKWTTPEVGDVVAVEHAVWRIDHVKPSENGEGVSVTAHHLAGWINPAWRVNSLGDVHLRIAENGYFDIYDGRWPACSCCGEPMPCRAELIDQAAAAAADRLDSLERRLPGCCWACCEPITARQQSVTYAGENLDLPGGPEVLFHTRRKCAYEAKHYEERWLAAGDQPRILTWPRCQGTLVVHHDGTSECHGGLEDCWGHSTHDHATKSACVIQSHGCPRGCPVEGHPGCAPRDRRARYEKRADT